MIILALVGTGLLEPGEALAGFASSDLIVVASVFVLSAALYRAGVSQALGRLIARLAGGSYTRVVAVLMSSVALMSAFTHHVTMTAVMLPTTLDLGRRHNIAASKLLLPLSFAASLGTTITIIGAPAFLVASAVLQQAGRQRLGIFSIAPIGLAISALGTLYMMTIGRLLLPERQAAAAAAEKFRLDDYFTELTVLPDSPFLDKKVSEIEEDESNHLAVVGLVRDGRRLRRPFDQRGLWRRHGWIEEELADVRLRPGDVLVLQGDDEALERIGSDRSFLMLVPFHGQGTVWRRAWIAAVIMAGTVVAATLNVPLEIAGLAGAVAMVLTGCLSPRPGPSLDRLAHLRLHRRRHSPRRRDGKERNVDAPGGMAPQRGRRLESVAGAADDLRRRGLRDRVHVRRRHHGPARPGGGRPRPGARTAARAVRGDRGDGVGHGVPHAHGPPRQPRRVRPRRLSLLGLRPRGRAAHRRHRAHGDADGAAHLALSRRATSSSWPAWRSPGS